MGDFFHPMTRQTAGKEYRCINCGEHILQGDAYCKQSGVWDSAWFTNHFHPECWDSVLEEGEFELTPYGGERPKIIDKLNGAKP